MAIKLIVKQTEDGRTYYIVRSFRDGCCHQGVAFELLDAIAEHHKLSEASYADVRQSPTATQ